MTLWLTIGKYAVLGNLALLIGLTYVWGRNYRRHGATHTRSLLVFALLLLVENAIFAYLYFLNDATAWWFYQGSTAAQAGMMGICGLEFVALGFLSYVTWQ
ncbi:MAG: hypothetical protein ABEI96_04685 [Haloarculaceae archaeon]